MPFVNLKTGSLDGLGGKVDNRVVHSALISAFLVLAGGSLQPFSALLTDESIGRRSF